MKKFSIKVTDNFLTKAIKDIFTAFKEISWPSLKYLIGMTLVVILISAIISAYLLGLDSGFSYIRNQILFN